MRRRPLPFSSKRKRQPLSFLSLSFSVLSYPSLFLFYFHPCPALSSTKSPRAFTSSSLSLAAKVHAPLGAQPRPYPGIFPLPEYTTSNSFSELKSPLRLRSASKRVLPGETTFPPPAWQPAQFREKSSGASIGDADSSSPARAGEVNGVEEAKTAASAAAASL